MLNGFRISVKEKKRLHGIWVFTKITYMLVACHSHDVNITHNVCIDIPKTVRTYFFLFFNRKVFIYYNFIFWIQMIFLWGFIFATCPSTFLKAFPSVSFGYNYIAHLYHHSRSQK